MAKLVQPNESNVTRESFLVVTSSVGWDFREHLLSLEKNKVVLRTKIIIISAIELIILKFGVKLP